MKAHYFSNKPHSMNKHDQRQFTETFAELLGEKGMPTNQRNAELGAELVMRAGVPHKGGRLALHAFNKGYPAMVSANAFWHAETRSFRFPEATDLVETDFALDSAGFTAMKLWQSRGKQTGMAGVFPWTYAQYLELAAISGASWYSAPDMCCEPEVAANQAEIDFRIDATVTLLEGCLRILYEWQNQLTKECSATTVANMVRPPVPILQGWSASDYERSLELTMRVWERWQPWLDRPALIGIGSVCRRTLKHPSHGLYAILNRLEGQIPDGSRAHLFGVKGAALDEIKMMPWIASVDSMAYDFGARINARKAGISNTLDHRTKEMTDWMSAAVRRMRPAAGDQYRLPLVV